MRYISVVLTTMLAIGCNQSSVGDHATEDSTDATASAAASAAPTSIYATAVANEARLEGDRVRDEGRKPANVLEFFGIEPGMTVLDMFAGGGYYTEILASVVGDDGKVVAQTNQAYLAFVGDEFELRFGNDRLANVEILMAENNELELVAESLDAIMLVLSYHDLFNSDPEQGWPRIDIPAFLAELHQALRPGGVFGIVDHYAESGAPIGTGNTVHRIDPAIVIADMTAAGFQLAAESDLLRNPDDDYSKIVFDPALRGKTDRFVMRFIKAD